ncbi:MAG: MptD family putative ECF transporter S component [Bacillota bacterium]|nr:MptD family putative ECF transporter S component [Bacillota bacterium]
MKSSSTSLNGKDLMNVGIFTAINVIGGIVLAIAIGLTPIGFVLIPFASGLLMGIPMMLYFTRIKKFGMVLILQVVNGVMLLLTGMGPAALIAGTIMALVVEYLMHKTRYQSGKIAVLSHALLCTSACANYLHWLNASAEWLAKNAETYGAEFTYTISGWFGYAWVLPAIACLGFVGGILGGLIGRRVLRKHFIKSGLM